MQELRQLVGTQMKTFRLELRPIFLILLISMYASLAYSESESWLRIESPSIKLKNQLSTLAIDYGEFVWVQKSKTSTISLSEAKRVTTYSNPFNLIAGNKSFDPVYDIPHDSSWFRNLSTNINDFHIIQFAGPMKPEWLQSLKELNIKPLKALAPYAYIVWGNSASISTSKNLPYVRWSGYFYTAFRVQLENRDLTSQLIDSMALVYRENTDSLITSMKNRGATTFKVRNIDTNFIALSFKVAGNIYSEIATIPGLLTIQRINQDAGKRGEMSQQSIVGSYDSNNIIFPGYQSWLTPTGIDGTGVVVGVVDGGVHENHPDLVDNMVACLGTGPSCGNFESNHGTHVAGAIGGSAVSGVIDDNGFLRGQGVAPRVSIVEQSYGPLIVAGPGGMIAGGMLSIYKDSAVSGVKLTNNSWGPTGTPQGYDIPTMEIDIISRDANPDAPGNQPVLAVWSIMNGGGDSVGVCGPSSLGSPDEAKNLFAVGSTKLQMDDGSQIPEIFDISLNSAHGPACDGRLVPHIVAPGCSTDATSGPNSYGLACGTSMASPVISGSVSLFWQWYVNTFSNDPSPAMVKATFTAVARDLSGFIDADGSVMTHAPDRKQGWGRVDLDKVINPINEVEFYDQQTVFTVSGENWNQEFIADDISKAVRIMLVWTDAAGAGLGGITPAWVNDLDLSITTNSGLYLGNVFGADGFTATGGIADNINNMEALFIKEDQHNGSPFSISVLAANIAADALNPYNAIAPAQDFALVCYNCKEYVDVGLVYKDSFEN